MNENPFKKSLLAGLATIGILGGSAQKITPSLDKTAHPEKKNSVTYHENEKGTVTSYNGTFQTIEKVPTNEDAITIYNTNKEVNDQNFNFIGYLDKGPETVGIIPENDDVAVACEGVGSITIKILHRDSLGKVLSKEKFPTLDSLVSVYPAYVPIVKKFADKMYQDHVMITGWNIINEKKVTTLANDFSTYVPSQNELDVIKKSIEDRKQGSINDGFDDIYHYYVDQLKNPADLYAFYQQHNGTPFALAKYMKLHYFEPFVTN